MQKRGWKRKEAALSQRIVTAGRDRRQSAAAISIKKGNDGGGDFALP